MLKQQVPVCICDFYALKFKEGLKKLVFKRAESLPYLLCLYINSGAANKNLPEDVRLHYEVRRLYGATVTSSKNLTKDVKCIHEGSYVSDNCTDILSLTAARDT